MRYRIGIVIGLLTCGLSGASAQTATRTPGKEEQRLQRFVGRWSLLIEVYKTALSAPRRWTGTNHTFELLPGGFAVVHRWDDDTDGDGVVERGIAITSYDASKRTYVEQQYTSFGDAGAGPFTWVGDSLRYADTPVHYHGKTGTERCAGAFAPTTLTVDCRVSLDRKTWVLESRMVYTRRP